MKFSKLILIGLISLLLAACGQSDAPDPDPPPPVAAPPTTEADKAAIRAFHKTWINSIAELNIEGELSHWEDDGILMAPNQAALLGKNAMRERLQFFNDVTVENVNVTIDEIQVSGDMAFIRQRFRSTWASKDGRNSEDEDGKEIVLLKRQPDNTWRIARYIWNSNLPARAH